MQCFSLSLSSVRFIYIYIYIYTHIHTHTYIYIHTHTLNFKNKPLWPADWFFRRHICTYWGTTKRILSFCFRSSSKTSFGESLFRRVRNISKSDISFVMSVRPFVRLSAWNNSAPIGRIFT
jgi:hypothetical protein